MSELGMTVLYEGEEPIKADVVFVHGLGGDSFKTWSADDKMWPRDFLKERVPHARIMTWGYDNDPVHFFKRQGYQSILSHSHDLLTDLKDEREDEAAKSRPIIFVGHSLGGLVVKQTLCKAVEYNGRHGFQRLAAIGTYCAGVVFMGTPHRGADMAAWATTATRLAKAIGVAGNDDIVASLKSGSPILESLQDTFAGIQSRFNIHTFLEAQAMIGVGKVVEDYHARLDCENEQCASISADHRNMCKFASNRDPGYRRVAGAIKEQVEDAREQLEQRIPSARIQSPQPLRPMSSNTFLPTNTETPPPFAEQSPPTERSYIKDVYDISNIRESLSSLSPQTTNQSQQSFTDVRSPSPSVPRQSKNPLGLANYKRLYQETLQIEGPCPPEKFQKKIDLLKENKSWVSSIELYRTMFNPETFDPNWQESRNKTLWLACYTGDVETVRNALAADADPEFRPPNNAGLPLHAAMTFDHTEIIRMLLQAGASVLPIVNASGMNEQQYMLTWLKILSAASLRVFLEHRGKECLPSTAALTAAELPQPDMLQILLLEYTFDFSILNDDGGTLLHIAAQHARVETVDWLISVGCPVDVIDNVEQTPLYDAISCRQSNIVDLLLSNHAASPNVQDKNGDTPLHVLITTPANADGIPLNTDEIAETKLGMMEALVRAGASLETSNSAGYRPLHLACMYGLGSITARLLQLGADANAYNNEGWTPLHLSVRGIGEQLGIAQSLLQAGASLKVRLPAPDALTPLELAKKDANAQMLSLMKNMKTERGVDKWLARHGVV